MGKFTEATTREALELYAQGLSTYELAKKYAVSRTAIKYLLRRNDVMVRARSPRKAYAKPPKLKRGENSTKRRKIKPEQEAELAEAYKAGASIEALAKQHGCTHKPMRNALQRAGVKFRPRGGAAKAWASKPGFKEKVLGLWESGLSQTKIGLKLGCSQSVVSKTLKGFGIEARAGKGRHGMWKGGKITNSYGYIMVLMGYDHPFASSMRTQNGYVLQHRLVVAEDLGRPLRGYETVHHINGDRSDNRIENLQLRSGKHGNHVRHRCLDCGSSNVESVEL